VIATGWREREVSACGQPVGPQGVEAGSSDTEPDTGVAWGELPVVERGEGGFDEFEGEAVEKLFVFIRASKPCPPLANQR